jgi:predicted GTPase
VTGPDALRRLAHLATEAGSPATAREADTLAERLAEGRFYVACVGQFKRGKSTLVNALVGEPVLPTGVVPITAAVTVVRFGPELRARVRFADRDWEECDPRGLETYVSEEHNPGNEKGVTGVEVFVRHALLASGMCLVDTPGLGSISEASTAATRAFVPHIDAVLVVLGADPPITGEELALVREVARQVDELIFVFNKADRTSDRERAEAVRFTERILSEQLRRPIGHMFEVSALERLQGGPPRRGGPVGARRWPGDRASIS